MNEKLSMSQSHHQPDGLDLRIIDALKRVPRGPLAEVARSVGTSRVTVQARLNKMQQSGVIANFDPQLDLRCAGFDVAAWVSVEINQSKLASITAEMQKIPNILRAYSTAGGADLLCLVIAESHARIQDVLIMLGCIPGINRTMSSLVLTTLFERDGYEVLQEAGL